MLVQGYGDVGVHKPAWPPQPHLLPPLDTQKPLDVKQLKSEIKLEPTDAQKRPHPENEMLVSVSNQKQGLFSSYTNNKSNFWVHNYCVNAFK